MSDHGVHTAMSNILTTNYARHDLAVISAITGTLLELYVLSDIQIICIMIKIRSNMIDYLMCYRQNRIRPCLRQAFLAKKLLDERIFVRFVCRPIRYKERNIVYFSIIFYNILLLLSTITY